MQKLEVTKETVQLQLAPDNNDRGIEHSKKIFIIKNPATGLEIATYPLMDKNDVDMLVATAKKTFEAWSRTSFSQRKAILIRASQYLAENAGTFAEQIAAENGKTKTDAFFEAGALMDYLKYTANHVEKALRPKKYLALNLFTPMRKCSYIYQPKGVVGVISPWNYPFALSGSPVISALAAGNTVILKPSSQTTRSGMIIKEIFDNAGLPEGVLQVLTGTGSLTGQALIEHKGVDMLFFTGSTEVGIEVASQAARNLIPVFLELGGIDAAIVTKNADIDRAAYGVAWGAFTNTGQTCISTELVLVDRAVYEPFIEKLIPLVANLKLGKGVGELGSMTMESQRRIVRKQLEDALAKGARILYQGTGRPDDNGFWCQPVLLGDVSMDMDIFNQETFGPLKAIMIYDSLDEAIAIANSTQYGLSGCVYTKDMREGYYVADRLKVGSVNINDCLMTYGIPDLPFGGVKKSGLGFYHGEIGIQAFTDIKSITANNLPLKKEFYWYPMLKDMDMIMENFMKVLYAGTLRSRAKALLSLLPKIPKIIRHLIWA